MRLSVACVSGPWDYYFSTERLAGDAACDGDDAAPNRAFSVASSAPEAQRRTDSVVADIGDCLDCSVENCLMSGDHHPLF